MPGADTLNVSKPLLGALTGTSLNGARHEKGQLLSAPLHPLGRCVLRATKVAEGKGKVVCGIRSRELEVQGRSNNKANCALANTIARIIDATVHENVQLAWGDVLLG